MIKKVLLLAAALATSSFATWDYFGIPQNSMGSVKGGMYYDWDGDWSQMGLKVAGRFNIAPTFELSVQGFGYQVWGETDCAGCEEGGNGIRDLVIGGRYALSSMVNVFIDFNLPIGKDKKNTLGRTPPSNHEMFLYFGGQFHNDIPALKGGSFGTEAGFFFGFEHHNKERGLELRLGGEFDYNIPSSPVTALIGGQLWIRLFRSEYDNGVKEVNLHDDWSNQFKFWVGANIAVNEQISINAQIIARSQDLKKKSADNNVTINMEGDALGLAADVEFKF